jgi:type IV secretory pathway VirB10-like protein
MKYFIATLAIIVAAPHSAAAQQQIDSAALEKLNDVIQRIQSLSGQNPAALPVRTNSQPADNNNKGEDKDKSEESEKKNINTPKHQGPTGKIAVGTLAEAIMGFTVISDYPGPWKGTLTQPIYSIDKKDVLFPEGSVIVGRTATIRGTNEAINRRMALIPTNIVTPDGVDYDLGDQSIVDGSGISGLADTVEFHLTEQIAAIAAYSVVQSAPNLINKAADANPVQGSFISTTQAAGQQLLERYTALVPTITINSGARFIIFFTKSLVVPVYHPRNRFEFSNYGKTPDAVPPTNR